MAVSLLQGHRPLKGSIKDPSKFDLKGGLAMGRQSRDYGTRIKAILGKPDLPLIPPTLLPRIVLSMALPRLTKGLLRLQTLPPRSVPASSMLVP